jgi:hypothetical protein
MDEKERPRDFAFQVGPYFPQTTPKRVHQWFANWPCKLDSQDILANGLSLFLRQFSEPSPDRLVASAGLKKHDR